MGKFHVRGIAKDGTMLYLGWSEFGEDYGSYWHDSEHEAVWYDCEDQARAAAELEIGMRSAPGRIHIFDEDGESRIGGYTWGRIDPNGPQMPYDPSHLVRFGEMCDEIIKEMGFDPKETTDAGV